MDEDIEEQNERVPTHVCQVRKCPVCSAGICYVGGFFCRSLQKDIKCAECLSALQHSSDDTCPERSLILMKSYFVNNKGLLYPSGSLCNLLFHAENVIRKNEHIYVKKNAPDLLLNKCLSDLECTFLKIHGLHAMETSVGAENHFNCVTRLVLKKYVNLRLKKIMQDYKNNKQQKGNYIHRTRIFLNA